MKTRFDYLKEMDINTEWLNRSTDNSSLTNPKKKSLSSLDLIRNKPQSI